MQLTPISNLIDKNTRIAKTMTAISRTTSVFNGYLAFVVNGELVQRRIYDMAYNSLYDSCMYIVHKKVNYAVNLPCKPISGAFNAESLKA
ncbi:g002 [Yersinia phage fHe-Yen9-04]|uniref:G002 protein n=2 Tax=Eneladusvirus Yen904 TaxID=2560849 RepID=A0A2C9CWK6_9CAUD|nr:hypothetical protein FDJ41_gp002 [Yersinia phage fHe-Yen9-04]SOK58279.1 g002 [Yersinia phage fHe-Yen9-04]SOK58810.1 hypothetical protein [Yersinia phage fHe-Yen9-03]VUE36048.1 g002 [Yersinia phage fHe-Yen9-04]